MFSLNILNSVTKIFVIAARGFKPQVMLRCFIRFFEFTEFLFHLEKTPKTSTSKSRGVLDSIDFGCFVSSRCEHFQYSFPIIHKISNVDFCII